MTLLTYKLYKAKVLNRPSKVNKSPYLLDIELENNPGTSVIAHNASLGCGGYVCNGAEIYVYENKGSDTVSKYTVFLVKSYPYGTEGSSDGTSDERTSGSLNKYPDGTFVCTQSILANKIGKILLENYFKFESIKAEYTVKETKELPLNNSRFDFFGIDPITKKPTLIEIKSVPLADYVDCLNKDYKKEMTKLIDKVGYDETGKILSPFQAIFPYGEKRKLELVSERALKHTNELKILSQEPYNYDCIMLYIVLRDDVSCLKISELDIEYRTAVLDAMKHYKFLAYSLSFSLERSSKENLSKDSKEGTYICNIDLCKQLPIF